MAKRILKVNKWLGRTPVSAICSSCGQTFKVPFSAMSRTIDAPANLQKQFDWHKCEKKHLKKPAPGL